MDNRFCAILHVRTKTLVSEVMCFFGAVKSKGSRTVQSKKADFVKKISLESRFFQNLGTWPSVCLNLLHTEPTASHHALGRGMYKDCGGLRGGE